jgi:hypothetical protein
MKSIYALLAFGVLLVSYAGIRAERSHPMQAKPAIIAAAAIDKLIGAPPAQTYTGTIVLHRSLYVLRDDRDDFYHLDDQEMPAKFLGRKVVVTGRRNAAADIIYVRDIEQGNS